jgi:hypothetical protein
VHVQLPDAVVVWIARGVRALRVWSGGVVAGGPQLPFTGYHVPGMGDFREKQRAGFSTHSFCFEMTVTFSAVDPWTAFLRRLFEDGLVELEPVVEVVEVDGSWEDAAVVGDAVSGEDIFSNVIAVAVALNGEVVAMDVGFREFSSVGANPGFELGVGGFVGFDEGDERVGIYAESVTGHGVVSFPEAGITVCEFACGFEADFLPESREVEGAEWTGKAGADEGDVLGHNGFGCSASPRAGEVCVFLRGREGGNVLTEGFWWGMLWCRICGVAEAGSIEGGRGRRRGNNRWSFPFLDGTFHVIRTYPPGLWLLLRETLVARSAREAL